MNRFGNLKFGFVSTLTGCSLNPNIPGQTTAQTFDNCRLTVGYVNGIFDPIAIETDNGEIISPFPIVGADGIRVLDPGARPLTEDDMALARRAAMAHCAEFGQELAPVAGVFYPAEAVWQFGRCME